MDELIDQQIGPLSYHQIDLSCEREGLVRFCHHLIGDASVAEDLAQETLIRAWQHAHQLRDPASRSGWLKAIARNVCRHWLRDHRTPEVAMPDVEGYSWAELDRAEPADAFDLEVELDRQDLATLLDRAMALLPRETREILVERFVRESPLAETAQRLGLSEGAVAMRLRRGKLALRRVLVTAFPEGLELYCIGSGEEKPAWKATRIWCPTCGRRRLEGLLVRDLGVFRLDCPACGRLNNSLSVNLFAQATGHRSALLHLLEWTDRLYKYSLDHTTIPCTGCGTVLVLRKDLSGAQPYPSYYCHRASVGKGLCTAVSAEPYISYYCHRCQGGTWNWQCSNLLSLPETRQFWKDHPRMRILPPGEVEAEGHPAIVTGFASETGSDRLDIVYARDDLRVLRIHSTRADRSRCGN